MEVPRRLGFTQRFEEHHDAGADHVAVQLIAEPGTDLDAGFRRLAGQVSVTRIPHFGHWLELRLAPGHTPGHGVVILKSGGDLAVFASDLPPATAASPSR